MEINRGFFPGVFTMGNAVFGFLAVLSVFEGQIVQACWFVILSGFLDVLDGKVARLSGTTSQFGIELDSLADFLSFGVAPAIIVHSTKLSSLGKWGWIISVVYIMASAYRLARFNLMADQEEKRGFLGLPVPAAAMTLVTFVIFSWHLWGELRYDELLVVTVVLLAFLMVSQVEYDALPDKFQTMADKLKLMMVVFAGVVIVVVLILRDPVVNYRVLLFPLMALYILSGIVREIYRLFTVSVGKVTGKAGNDERFNKKEGNDRS